MLTVKQVAERLNVSETFVRALLRSGRLYYHRLGKGQGGIRISEEQLLDFLSRTEVRGRQPAPPAPKRITLKHLTLD